MKTLYIECNMGAAGDMLTAALLELHPDREEAVRKMNSFGIEDVEVKAETTVKCGITGTGVRVLVRGEEEHSEDVHEHHHGHEHEQHHEHHSHENDHHHEPHDEHHEHEHHHHHHHNHEHTHEHHHHHHTGMDEIANIISGIDAPQKVKDDALMVYKLIAKAEAKAHGKDVQEIHFHEVGNKDAISDILNVCFLVNEINPDKIVVSPIHVGSGQVKCAHGILPVPAPATAHILRGVPIYGGRVRGELCTPTGAALLKHFADEFGNMPIMKVEAIGYGMGKKDFEDANCVRAMLGETEEAPKEICELNCNIDDMTGEAVGYATSKLLEAGALDVFTTPVYMKKNRPGIMLTVLCNEEKKSEIAREIFACTTTIGIREHKCQRYELERTIEEMYTQYGKVNIKEVSGYGVRRRKVEAEDIMRIAKENGLSFNDVSSELS
ncbi:MAG: nickel pincer cofactor biosynthesis protein LarC [Lachnospiraceae bacterium]|nr:nickel pincer cofactor biosynthesis protein LarC [Lachnospiraceae bacterium]